MRNLKLFAVATRNRYFYVLTTYAVNDKDVQISGGGGGASKIDAPMSHRMKQIRCCRETQTGGEYLTTVLQTERRFRI